MGLEGKVIYITGGSKGIGYGVAQACLEQGMKVAITGRTKKSLQAAVKGLEKYGMENILAIPSDVRDLSAEKKAIKATVKKFKKVDVCIANAGIGHFETIDKMTSKQWNEVIDINLTGVFHTVKASLSAIKKSKGYIITIASLAGTNFFARGAAYNASKFGLVGFTQAIMLDLRNDGVKVSTIMPGSVSTHFNNHKPSKKDAWKIQPEDIGKLVVDLLTMNPRTLPSKIEVRPSMPNKK